MTLQMSDIKFDYYNSVDSNIHSFVVRAAEVLSKKIAESDPEYKYVAVMNRGMDALWTYAKEQKADDFEFETPIKNLHYVEEFSSHLNLGLWDRWTDKVFRFKSEKGNYVYVSNLIHLHQEYDDVFCCETTAIVAKSKEDADSFVRGYQKAKWQRHRTMPCVLGYAGERMKDFRKMDWDEIYLHNDMTNEIRNEIDTFFKNKKAYEEHHLDWKRGIMLAGRPGNGKTAICRAIASHSSVPVIYCTLDDDDMFRILERVSKTIKQNAPCIVIFEDADTLGSNPALRSAMLNMLDGLFTASGVLTIASTNAPEKLDEAFTGRPSRFDSFYVIGDPEPKERREILLTRLSDKGKKLPKKPLAALIKEMAGLSAACVQEVAVCALLSSLKTRKPVNMAMLQASLEKMKKHLRNSEDGVEKTSRGAIGFEPARDDDF